MASSSNMDFLCPHCMSENRQKLHFSATNERSVAVECEQCMMPFEVIIVCKNDGSRNVIVSDPMD